MIDRRDVAALTGLLLAGTGAWLLWGAAGPLLTSGGWMLLMVALRGERTGG